MILICPVYAEDIQLIARIVEGYNDAETNSSGFSALLGGSRYIRDQENEELQGVLGYYDMGDAGSFWSQGEESHIETGNSYLGGDAAITDIGYEFAVFWFDSHPKFNGNSVRCLKNR